MQADNKKQVAIIGGTGGLGRALARQMALSGAQVIVVGQTFRDADVAGIRFIKADLSSMREAQRVAAALPAESLDLLVFTTGIFAAPQREQTAEGVERDLAVSYLNRLVILRDVAPRLDPQRAARVFIMGYPGSGQAGNADDLNCERSYKPMAAHLNTVAGNEMLVLDAATRYPHASFFGLNPGLVKTAIRDNFFGKGSLKSRVVESLIGLMTPSADDYARRIAPLLLAPGLEASNGAMFNNKGKTIQPSKGLDPAHIRNFMDASAALLERVGVRINKESIS